MRRQTRYGAWIVVAVVCAAALRAQEAVPAAGTFTFAGGGSESLSLTIDDADGTAGITWPAVDARWDTALLGVQISAGADAPAPYIEISAGNAADRQYFASGDSGLRWLNLSLARGTAAGTRIALRADGVAFSAREASLRLFASDPDGVHRPYAVFDPDLVDQQHRLFQRWLHAALRSGADRGPDYY